MKATMLSVARITETSEGQFWRETTISKNYAVGVQTMLPTTFHVWVLIKKAYPRII